MNIFPKITQAYEKFRISEKMNCSERDFSYNRNDIVSLCLTLRAGSEIERLHKKNVSNGIQ